MSSSISVPKNVPNSVPNIASYYSNEKNELVQFVVDTCYEKFNVKKIKPVKQKKSFLQSISIFSSEKNNEIQYKIRPETIKYLGKYKKSENVGYGDNGTRIDTFELNGQEITNVLDYDGSTRYRIVNCNDSKEYKEKYLKYKKKYLELKNNLNH